MSLGTSTIDHVSPNGAPLRSSIVASARLELIAISGMPVVCSGDDLAEIVWQKVCDDGVDLADQDVLVVTQKIVSKAEGRMVLLDDVTPSAEATHLAQETDKDARMVQLILNESTEILRMKKGVIIVEHRLGLTIANAGIDQSNVPDGYALLLPEDPDQSARRMWEALTSRCGKQLAVIITDSIGRAWRNGSVGHAVGVAGLEPIVDLRGRVDLLGRPLQRTRVAAADAIAAAATLLMGEADESRPVVIVRGYTCCSEHVGVGPLLRDRQHEMFR